MTGKRYGSAVGEYWNQIFDMLCIRGKKELVYKGQAKLALVILQWIISAQKMTHEYNQKVGWLFCFPWGFSEYGH